MLLTCWIFWVQNETLRAVSHNCSQVLLVLVLTIEAARLFMIVGCREGPGQAYGINEDASLLNGHHWFFCS